MFTPGWTRRRWRPRYKYDTASALGEAGTGKQLPSACYGLDGYGGGTNARYRCHDCVYVGFEQCARWASITAQCMVATGQTVLTCEYAQSVSAQAQVVGLGRTQKIHAAGICAPLPGRQGMRVGVEHGHLGLREGSAQPQGNMTAMQAAADNQPVEHLVVTDEFMSARGLRCQIAQLRPGQ